MCGRRRLPPAPGFWKGGSDFLPPRSHVRPSLSPLITIKFVVLKDAPIPPQWPFQTLRRKESGYALRRRGVEVNSLKFDRTIRQAAHRTQARADSSWDTPEPSDTREAEAETVRRRTSRHASARVEPARISNYRGWGARCRATFMGSRTLRSGARSSNDGVTSRKEAGEGVDAHPSVFCTTSARCRHDAMTTRLMHGWG